MIVSGEEDMLVSCPSSAPYVEAAEESLETTFQSFEVVSCASVEMSPLLPCLSNVALMVERVMLRHNYEPGMGLGKDSHENADVVDIRGNPYKYGLGYEPEKSGRRNTPSRLRADRASPGHVSQCFTSAGIMFKEEVEAAEEEEEAAEEEEDPAEQEEAAEEEEDAAEETESDDDSEATP